MACCLYQAITWNIGHLLLIEPWRTNFSKILILEIAFEKLACKMGAIFCKLNLLRPSDAYIRQ